MGTFTDDHVCMSGLFPKAAVGAWGMGFLLRPCGSGVAGNLWGSVAT